MQFLQRRLFGFGCRPIPCQSRSNHARHTPGRDVCGDRDRAYGTFAHARNVDGVLAGEQREVLAAQRLELRDAAHLSACFLERDDVLMRGEATDRLGLQVTSRALWYVVEHHRQVHVVGDGREVPVQAFLRRPVVVRRDLKRSVRTSRTSGPRHFERLAGVVGAGARDHGHPAIHDTHNAFNDTHVLVDRKGCGFTCRTHRHNAVRTFGDMPLHETIEGIPIEVAGGVHGRDDGDDAALNHEWRARLQRG